MGKKTHPNNNNNNNRSAVAAAGATQQHLSRESGRIRQRQEQNQPYYNNNNHFEEQEEQKNPQQTAQEKFADNVNLLVLNLNSNPEQIYRQTIGKMLHSMTTPFTEKFKINSSSEKQQEGGEENDKKNKKNKNKNNKNHQASTSENNNNNDNHDLSPETASFFSEDQQTATMLIHFPDKFSAKKLAQKLNQGQLFAGTSTNSSNNNDNNNSSSSGVSTTAGQLHASVVPTESLKPRYEPCALRITELTIPSASSSSTQNNNNTNNSSNKNNNNDSSSSSTFFTLSQLQQYLSSNPGFLSVSKVARIVGGGSGKKNQERKPCFVATYADSGAALQARALMSGRAFHGVHLLLELIEEENEQIVPLV